MTPDQIDEVWSMLDREQLAAITRKGPEPIFATISGAHLYGFASRDSDGDLSSECSSWCPSWCPSRVPE